MTPQMAEALAALGVSRETYPRLEELVDRLARWNPRINLVAPSTLADSWRRHVLDSAQLWPLRPTHARRWIDLGSGAGFPGLVIAAIAADSDPELAVTLVESDARKCAFLSEAARAMGIAPTVVNRRIETLDAPTHDVVSARALAPLTRLLPLAHRVLAPGGVCLFLKGVSARDELTEASRAWHSRAEVVPSVTDPSGAVLRLAEISPC
jgi:16S rRNA (guanine527-N7)-methyltransferase